MPHIRIVTDSELSAESLLARDYIKESNGNRTEDAPSERRLKVVEGGSSSHARSTSRRPAAKKKGERRAP